MSEAFRTKLNEFLSSWLGDLSRDLLPKMLADTERFVDSLAAELSDKTRHPEEERNYLYVAAIFIRGLYDYTLIRMVLQDSHWHRNTDLLDCVWTKYWDCRDRFAFSRSIAAGDFVDHLATLLDSLAAFYQENLGEGLYMSPDILIRREECSICGSDFRSCQHIAGRLYNGLLCRAIAREFEPQSASIVDHPEDPRCRLWPWNCDPNKSTIKGAVMTFFQIDDFLFNKDWAKIGQPSHAGHRVSADGPAKPGA